MTQNIREQFKKRFDGYWRGEAISDEIILWWIDKLNTTLKEIEEGVGKMKHELGQEEFYENTDNEWRKEGYNQALDDIKQLIHQKLIK